MSEPTKEDLLVPILSEMRKLDEEALSLMKANFSMIQQQMQVIEAQLNSVTVLVSRNTGPVMSAEARAESLKLAKEQADTLQKQLADEEEAILAARRGRGIGDGGDAVTPEDIEQWRRGE